MRNHLRHPLSTALVALALMPALPAAAQLTLPDIFTFVPPPEQPVYARDRLAKAKADECFAGIGVDYPPLAPDGTCNSGQPKVNLAYVWGLTQAGVGDTGFAGDEIWFGTIANPLCEGAAGVAEPEPYLRTAWVCEFGQSMLSRYGRLPPPAGDWRLPRIYSYKVATRQLTDRTPVGDRALGFVTGFRSAGSVGNAVFVAGPNMASQVVFAAFDASTGAFKGSCRALTLRNIRSWITINGVLYAGVGLKGGGGAVLRWRGTIDDPFAGAASPSDTCGFEVAGTLPDMPAYLADYGGTRMAATVWADTHRESSGSNAALAGNPYTSGLYLGPLYGDDGGYTNADAATAWQRLWRTLDYERDPIVAATAGGGALAYWKGWLWFGTMHNTGGTIAAHTRCTLPKCFGPPQNDDEALTLLLNVSRAASIWRARRGDDGRPQVELLYGETQLPALVPGTRTFAMQPTGWVPRYGRSGMNNPFLTYTWSASASADDLLFGFYDYRYVFDANFGIIPAPTGRAPSSEPDPKRGYGADIWRFSDPELPAVPEATAGLTNFSNYGVRNMLRLDGGTDVILGIANSLNLEPQGGWELIRLTPPGAPGR